MVWWASALRHEPFDALVRDNVGMGQCAEMPLEAFGRLGRKNPRSKRSTGCVAVTSDTRRKSQSLLWR